MTTSVAELHEVCSRLVEGRKTKPNMEDALSELLNVAQGMASTPQSNHQPKMAEAKAQFKLAVENLGTANLTPRQTQLLAAIDTKQLLSPVAAMQHLDKILVESVGHASSVHPRLKQFHDYAIAVQNKAAELRNGLGRFLKAEPTEPDLEQVGIVRIRFEGSTRPTSLKELRDAADAWRTILTEVVRVTEDPEPKLHTVRQGSVIFDVLVYPGALLLLGGIWKRALQALNAIETYRLSQAQIRETNARARLDEANADRAEAENRWAEEDREAETRVKNRQEEAFLYTVQQLALRAIGQSDEEAREAASKLMNISGRKVLDQATAGVRVSLVAAADPDDEFLALVEAIESVEAQLDAPDQVLGQLTDGTPDAQQNDDNND